MGWRFAAVAVVLGALGIAPSFAQTTNTESHVYRLAKTSTFERGCFPPCLCPVTEGGVERGTFLLTAAGSDGLFDKYRVSEVNWIVMVTGGDRGALGVDADDRATEDHCHGFRPRVRLRFEDPVEDLVGAQRHSRRLAFDRQVAVGILEAAQGILPGGTWTRPRRDCPRLEKVTLRSPTGIPRKGRFG